MGYKKDSCGCNSCGSYEAIIDYLGEYLYNLLKENVELPCNHASLYKSLAALSCGKELPYNHPSLEEILCGALGCCEDDDCDDYDYGCDCGCNNSWGNDCGCGWK